jgi:hypothetical protein
VPSGVERLDQVARTALQGHAAEQPTCGRHGEQRRRAHRPGGLPEHRDVVRVAPEGRDVVPDPFERGHLVEQPQVRDAVAQREEPLDAQPVVDADEHHAVPSEAASVVEDAAAAVEPAAVHPHHHR